MVVSAKVGKYKNLELETCICATKNDFDIIKLHIYNTRKQDHAGFNFNLTILGLTINFSILDVRHWDIKNNNWYEYDIVVDDGGNYGV